MAVISNLEKYLSRQKVILLPVMEMALSDGLFVVIPAYNETDNLSRTLNNLISISISDIKVNVVVVINCGVNDDEAIVKASKHLFEWCVEFAQQVNSSSFRILPIGVFDFPAKEKGVGLARKTGMDQVAAFCHHHQVLDAIIVSLDADSVVADNYFIQLQKYFSVSSHLACSIYYEHPLQGTEFSTSVYDAIVLYELHLRYYIQCLKAAGFPYAFHTFGSAMAFRSSAYVNAGGMTKKPAGEDFYMIHKLVLQGGFGELNSTCVYPSPRPSNRVFFGTGATVHSLITNQSSEYFTYNLQAFIDLKSFFDIKEQLFKASFQTYEAAILKLSGRMRSFLTDSDFWADIENINSNCSTIGVFSKRFFEVFNAFRIIKYLNFVHEHYLEKTEVTETASTFLMMNDRLQPTDFLLSEDLLKLYREIDRQEVVMKIS